MSKRDVLINEMMLKANKEFGKNALYRLSERPIIRTYIPTGIPELDAVIGGGMVPGRSYEFFGLNSAGKTMMCYHLMGLKSYWSSLFLDFEGSIDEDMIRQYGADPANIHVMHPKYTEQALKMLWLGAEAGIPIMVLDSIGAMSGKATIENTNFEKQSSVGSTARLLSDRLNQIMGECDRENEREEKGKSVLIFINQIRSKIGFTGYGDPVETPGGHALHHWVSVRLYFKRVGWIKDTLLDDKFPIGQEVRVIVKKSKVCKPMREAHFALLYDRGFCSMDALDEHINEMRKEQGFRPKRVSKLSVEQLEEEDRLSEQAEKRIDEQDEELAEAYAGTTDDAA